MSKNYLISILTAAALGYAANFATNGLVAKASIPITQCMPIAKELDISSNSTLEALLTAQLCANVSTTFNSDISECTTKLLRNYGLHLNYKFDKNTWEIKTDFCYQGTFVKGSPQ